MTVFYANETSNPTRATFTPKCSWPCDDDCDAGCHQGHHLPRYWDHDPATCPGERLAPRTEEWWQWRNNWQPGVIQKRRDAGAVTVSTLLLVVAVVCLAIFTLAAHGTITTTEGFAWLGAGLTFWCLAGLVP